MYYYQNSYVISFRNVLDYFVINKKRSLDCALFFCKARKKRLEHQWSVGRNTRRSNPLNSLRIPFNLKQKFLSKAILAGMNTTELTVRIRPEKYSGPYGIWTHDLQDSGAALYQLS